MTQVTLEPDETVIDKSELKMLMDVDRFMDALEAAGVDNWEGYEVACRIYNGELQEGDL
jgi:hypothetical protein